MSDNVGPRSFGGKAAYPGDRNLSQHLIRFFDRYLKGEDNGYDREDPVWYYLMGENRWYHAAAWPLPESREKTMYLHSAGLHEGRLEQACGADGSTGYISDPADPVPARMPGINAECQDQTPVESRPDVAVFTSDMLEEDLRVIGEVNAVLYVSSDCPDTDVVCKLTEVFPDGRSLNLTDGAVRVSYNNSWDRRLLENSEVRRVEVHMGNTCNLFRKGSRIRLDVSGSVFPKYDKNHHVADRIGSTERMVLSHDVLYTGSGHPSCLILTVQP